jgi:hypothetical protein
MVLNSSNQLNTNIHLVEAIDINKTNYYLQKENLSSDGQQFQQYQQNKQSPLTSNH